MIENGYDALEEPEEMDGIHRERLRLLLSQFTGKCRTIYELWFQRKTYQEIAPLVGLKNDNQVKKAVYRCRKKVRSTIAAHKFHRRKHE